jgi:Sec-independent protein translocase protein TatA
VKALFSPVGLALLLLVAAIVFFPRRAPDNARRLGKPMRAFDDEPPAERDEAEANSAAAQDNAGGKDPLDGRR